jgi:hypothetical protein
MRCLPDSDVGQLPLAKVSDNGHVEILHQNSNRRYHPGGVFQAKPGFEIKAGQFYRMGYRQNNKSPKTPLSRDCSGGAFEIA